MTVSVVSSAAPSRGQRGATGVGGWRMNGRHDLLFAFRAPPLRARGPGTARGYPLRRHKPERSTGILPVFKLKKTAAVKPLQSHIYQVFTRV